MRRFLGNERRKWADDARRPASSAASSRLVGDACEWCYEMRWLPGSDWGKWCARLFVIALFSFALIAIASSLGAKRGRSVWDDLLLVTVGVAAVAAGLAAVVIGTASILIKGERAILVFVSCAVGLLFLLWVVLA